MIYKFYHLVSLIYDLNSRPLKSTKCKLKPKLKKTLNKIFKWIEFWQRKRNSQTVRAIYMDLYTIGCTVETPIVWYIQKYMLIGKIFFYFCFVYAICSSKMKTRHVTHDLLTEKVLSCWDNFNSCDAFTYTIGRDRKWLSVSRSINIRSEFRITKIQRSESSVTAW